MATHLGVPATVRGLPRTTQSEFLWSAIDVRDTIGMGTGGLSAPSRWAGRTRTAPQSISGCVERGEKSRAGSSVTIRSRHRINSQRPNATLTRSILHTTRRDHSLPRLAAALLISALLVSCGDKHGAAHPHAITLTFIRHGQSTGNASGRVDTSVPGPGLTDLGRRQALRVADRFSASHYDGVFASTMVRTQQTAYYLALRLNTAVTVLPGLREIEGGVNEGQPESLAAPTTFGAVEQWLMGHRDVRIPGSIDGNEFDKRFDEAVQSIYDSGDRQPVAFSHGAAIAVWTLMNVKNPRADLLRTQPLPNTGYVVVRGDPPEGWTVVDWNGTKP